MELQSPWNPGGATTTSKQGTFDVMAATTVFLQVFAGHKYYLAFNEVPYCLALFQWEIAWQPEAGEQVSMRVRLAVTTYLRAKPRELPDVSAPVVTKFQQLNLLYYYRASKLRSVRVLELQGSTCNLFPPGTCQAHKVQSYTKFSFSDRNGEGIYFKVGHLFYHVAHHTTQGAYRCSGVTVYSHFHMCMGMSNGELLQWLANNLCGSDVSIIQSLHDEDQFWVLVNLDGEVTQHRNSHWDPGGCMIALCSFEKRWTTLHYHAHLQWSPLHLADTFLIWWVAWTVDGLEFSMCHGQAPFQVGRNVIRAAFSDHVQVSPNYCIDIIYYRGDYRHDPSRSKKIHVPWDLGKSGLQYPWKLRLGDKPSFKKGGMLGPLLPRTSLGRVPWARIGQLIASIGSSPTSIQGEATKGVFKLDQELATAAPVCSTSTLFPSSFLLVLVSFSIKGIY
jgi:hypothetical protein